MNHSIALAPSSATHMSVELPTTMGLDLSDRRSTLHVLRGDGHTLATGKVETRREELARLFKQWTGCRLVIEAGTHSPWISRLGEECGMEVVVANPRQVEVISKSDRKNDRSDAETLADLGRTNVKRLAPIQHRSKQAQADLGVQRARSEIVGARTALINHVRGVLKSHGYRAPSTSSACFARRVGETLPPELATALGPMLRLIQFINTQIKGYETQLTDLGRMRYPIMQQLQKLPGVGPIGSLTFAMTLEDPARFRKARQVGAYAGMVPRQKDSGDSNPQLHITKAGDHGLRRQMVLSAHYILGRFGPDCDLRRFGLRIAGNGGNKAAKKRAVVAVARKLSVLMYHLWKTGQEYDPFHLAKRRGEPVPS